MEGRGMKERSKKYEGKKGRKEYEGRKMKAGKKQEV